MWLNPAHWGRAEGQAVQVLAYHAIADLPVGSPLRKYSVPPAEFSAQLDAMLRMGYGFVDLGVLLAGLDGTRPLPERGALITFDDCYEDLRTVAAPILTAHGIPAVAFAVAGRLGETNDWDADGEHLQLLDGEGLRALRPLGIEVGAHSVTHRALTGIAPGELGAEVAHSLPRLESAGLDAPRAFAYPHGRSNAAVVAAVRDAGFAAAFTTRAGLVRADSDRYLLPRMEVRRGDTGLRFRLRLAAAHAPRPVRALARLG